MACPQNSAKKVPMIKKGAKGISLFNPFFWNIIEMIPTTAPVANAKNNQAKILGNPKINPNKIASFTSPNPIQRPPDTKKIAKKNPEAMTTANI